jgi:two-component system chemotaxis response regulator CheY
MAIDDSASFLMELESIISKGGHQLLSTTDTTRALRLVAEHQDIDLFLLDYNMPKANGITMCQEIRKLSPYEKTPIIMLTSFSSEKMMASGREAGVTAWVIKPNRGLQILTVIDKILKAGKA